MKLMYIIQWDYYLKHLVKILSMENKKKDAANKEKAKVKIKIPN